MPEPFFLSQEPACAREEPRGSVTRSSSLINRGSQRHRRPPSRHGQGTAAMFATTSWKAAWSESASRNVSAVSDSKTVSSPGQSLCANPGGVGCQGARRTGLESSLSSHYLAGILFCECHISASRFSWAVGEGAKAMVSIPGQSPCN